MVPERYNASQILDQNLEAGRGDKVAIRSPGHELTYAQLAARAAQAGHLLAALGVEAEQRVLLALDDTPLFPALFLGAMRMGAVPVTANPLDRAENFRHYVRDSGAGVCVIEPELRESFAAEPGARVFEADAFSAMLDAQPEELEVAATHRDDAAFWLYSSGSTGLPKGVVHLHHDMAVTHDSYARAVLEITERDVCYSTTKLFHAYGLGNGLTFPLTAGATVILVAGTQHSGDGARRRRDIPADALLQRPSAVPGDARSAAGRSLVGSHVRVRRRGAAELDRRALGPALRRRDRRRHRVDRDAAHLLLQPPR